MIQPLRRILKLLWGLSSPILRAVREDSEETPSAVLEYLRGRLREANTKEALRATKLQAPPGAHASAITKLSNRVHKEVLYDESHVACLESLKDEFGLLTSATTAPGLLKCFLNAMYVRKVDVIPVQLGLAM